MRGFFLLLAPLFFATASFAEYFVFYENGKAGLRDDAGKVVLPASFDALGWADNSFSVINQVTGYRQQSKWGLINLKKEFITKAEYETLTSAGGDRIIASKKINPYTRKFGCIDLTGKIKVPFHYDGISITGLRAIVFVKNGTRYEHGVVDLNNTSIIPLQFREIRAIGSLRFAVQNFDRKTALFSEEGTRLTDFAIDSIAAFFKGHAVIYQGIKQGLIDREGIIRLEPGYREIRIANDGAVTARGFDTWKLVDMTNKEITSIAADDLIADNSAYILKISGTQGVVDKDFKPIISNEYNSIGSFENNLMVARRGKKYGVIRKTGTTVLPFEFDTLVLETNFVRAATLLNGQQAWSVYDTFGIKKSTRSYDFVDRYNGKYFPVQHRGYWGAADRYGNEILTCVYDSIIEFDHEVAAVRFKQLYGIIDFDEKWIVTPQPNPLRLATGRVYFEQQDSITFLKNFDQEILYFTGYPMIARNGQIEETAAQGVVRTISEQGIITTAVARPGIEDAEAVYEESEGMRGIRRAGRYGFIDSRGRLRVANRYEGIGKFSEGLAPVMIMGKWGFVNREDIISINPNFEYTDGFSNGIAIVGRAGKRGLIDRSGKIVLPLRYDSLTRTKERVVIINDNMYGLADLSGHVLVEPRFETLDVVDEQYILVQSRGRWGVITHDGLPVIPMMYDLMKFDPQNKRCLAVVRGKWETISF